MRSLTHCAETTGKIWIVPLKNDDLITNVSRWKKLMKFGEANKYYRKGLMEHDLDLYWSEIVISFKCDAEYHFRFFFNRISTRTLMNVVFWYFIMKTEVWKLKDEMLIKGINRQQTRCSCVKMNVKVQFAL